MSQWFLGGMAAGLAAGSLLMAAAAGAAETNAPLAMDLPTALRLAGAQNLEVRIAQERLNKARAEHDQARAKFFPWFQPSVGYRRHDGHIQDVAGNILDLSKQSYSPGVLLGAQVDLGEAIYQSLAAKQRTVAAQETVAAERQKSVASAAAGFLELSRAQGAVEAAREAVRIAEDYLRQVTQAVAAGIAFKGDQFRAEVRVEQNRQLLAQVETDRRVAAARLCQLLRLDPATDLAPVEVLLAPLKFPEAEQPLAILLAQAHANRPELRAADASLASAKTEVKGVTVGPLIPTVSAQASAYGLGGGRNGDGGNWGDGQDYFVGLSWRIGPGGLFDGPRKRSALAREKLVELEKQRLQDEIATEVVEAHARAASLDQRLAMSQRALQAAHTTLQLTRERKEFGVGAVLETLQAEEQFTRARLDYLQAIAALSRAHFDLHRAIGWPIATTLAPAP